MSIYNHIYILIFRRQKGAKRCLRLKYILKYNALYRETVYYNHRLRHLKVISMTELYKKSFFFHFIAQSVILFLTIVLREPKRWKYDQTLSNVCEKKTLIKMDNKLFRGFLLEKTFTKEKKNHV